VYQAVQGLFPANNNHYHIVTITVLCIWVRLTLLNGVRFTIWEITCKLRSF